MKKILFAIALTLALTTGIASPISAAAQVQTKSSPITSVDKDGPNCDPWNPCNNQN